MYFSENYEICVRRILSLVISVMCFLSLSGPALATENDQTYGICIDLVFSDSESVEHGVADYQANVFLVQDADGLFLIAEYDQDTGSYIIVGTTAEEKEATRFRCGRNHDVPGLLQINALPAGSYAITMTDVTDSFVLLKDEIEVVISGGTATVDGHEVTLAGQNVPITIQITHGYLLPDVCGGCRIRKTLLFISVLCFVLVIVLLIDLLINWLKKKHQG